MRLTDEQKKRVEDNHNLIYSFLNNRNVSIDDYYDVAAIGLCKAAATFEADKGFEFSTYAYKIMLNELRQEMRKESRRDRIETISAETPIAGDESMTLINTPPASRGNPDDVMRCRHIEWLINQKPESQQKIIRMKMAGYTQTHIADEIGTTLGWVNQVIGKFRKELKRELGRR